MYVFCITVAISVLNLALNSQLVKKWQTFSEIEDGGVRHFELWQLCIFNVKDVFLIEDPPNVSTKFSEDRSNNKYIFRNSRWRRMSSWIYSNIHFQHHRYVSNGSPNVFTNFGDDRSNTKETAYFLSKSKMAAAAILIYCNVDFSTSPMLIKSK